MATDSTKIFAGPQASSPSWSGTIEHISESARLCIHVDFTPTSPTDFGETALPAWAEANPKVSQPPPEDNSVRGHEHVKQPPEAASTSALGRASDLENSTEQRGVMTRVLYSLKGQAVNELDIECDEVVLPIESKKGAVSSQSQSPASFLIKQAEADSFYFFDRMVPHPERQGNAWMGTD